MQTVCDKCKAEIHPQQETLHYGEIEHTFFRCPECDEVYRVCTTDAALRKDIAGYTRMRLLIQRQRCTEKFIRNAEALKKTKYETMQGAMRSAFASSMPLTGFLSV